MSGFDWLVLCGTIFGIAAYGAWKSRGVRDLDTYLRGDSQLRWPTIGLSIMATQASAITFLSTPGQAYEDGMRFVQFYFGLPLAMIVISAVFLPIYHRLRVYTAYEYLEHRFDVRVRTAGALLFLIQRGLAAGITIYAPAILLSTILGWPLQSTNLGIGVCVIAYTVSGGTQAVSQTQKHQMVVMLLGLVVAAAILIGALPDSVSLPEALRLAGALDRMNVVQFEIDPNSRYTFWSGITGGFFLALAYFGTDQSQVQRYLAGRSLTESRLGLLFNGMFKIPMQFVILMVGVLLYVFHLFTPPPIFFNEPALRRIAAGSDGEELGAVEIRFAAALARQRAAAIEFLAAAPDDPHARRALRRAAADVEGLRKEARDLVARVAPEVETRDTDYIFLNFVLGHMPHGIIGLLIAVILCAAMSSTASELSALGATTTVDLYKRHLGDVTNQQHDVRMSQLFTVAWGCIAIAFAMSASLFDNLIEAVNILGSIFYGTILGLFVVAFFLPSVGATPVLYGAAAGQALVLLLFLLSDLGFLWYNAIGCATVAIVALLARGRSGNSDHPVSPGNRS